MDKKLTYKDAGVDIAQADTFVHALKRMVKPTFRHEVISDIGGFGSFFALHVHKYQEPVLVSSTDGVGTKLRVAFMMDRHDTVGIDLVAMCANDVIAQGAEPLFMLDYISTGKIRQDILESIAKGIVSGCIDAGCSLIGGETAEMPSFYPSGEYDLAGFVVGAVDKAKIIDGSSITVGDSIIGIASNGIHSNGLSLARELIFNRMGLSADEMVTEFGCSAGEELLKPTKIYVRTVLNIIRDFEVKGIAHITGGGFMENIPRILPEGCMADIQRGTWKIPAIFTFLQKEGSIEDEEMMRTFNNGIGMVLVVKAEEEDEILLRLDGLNETGYCIGKIEAQQPGGPAIRFTHR